MKKFPFAVSLSVFLFLAATEAWANSLTYTIDYRNPSISIPEEKKQAVIDQALKNWPNSKVESHWDYVYDQAISHSWNPAFVIALWIEESGASGVDAYDLGCLGGNRNDIVSQLNCLFARPYANETFRTFMCKYSVERKDCYTNPNYNFSNNPYFPTNLGIWYCRLTGDESVCNNLGDDIDPDQPPYAPYSEETILLKDSLASNNLTLSYKNTITITITLTPTPSPLATAKVLGEEANETTNETRRGELYITEEGKNVPDFQSMEEILSFSLEKLLPENLRKELAIDNSQNIVGKTLQFIYGTGEDGKKISPEEGDEREIPEDKTTFPSWWSQLIGESKIICGLFNTCDAPESMKIKIAAAEEYNPPEGLGHRDSAPKVEEKKVENEVTKKEFTISSFFKKIITDIIDELKKIFVREETTETTGLAETRAIVPGGENIRENTSFFKNFLPASAIPAYHNSPLKVSADYKISDDYTIIGGEEKEKLEYHNLGASQRNYCLSLCSQYPADFDISQIDPLCPSCNPDDYPLEGYGDIPLSKELCRSPNGEIRQEGEEGECHYYDPPNGTNEGCEEGKDPVCEGGRCNPYELNSDDYNKRCPDGTLEYKKQGCRNPNVCYEMTFAQNPAGGFGECQYANPTVCVRADRLKVGKCAAVCNWLCCAEQQK